MTDVYHRTNTARILTHRQQRRRPTETQRYTEGKSAESAANRSWWSLVLLAPTFSFRFFSAQCGSDKIRTRTRQNVYLMRGTAGRAVLKAGEIDVEHQAVRSYRFLTWHATHVRALLLCIFTWVHVWLLPGSVMSLSSSGSFVTVRLAAQHAKLAVHR